jgi:hypothetical protein
MAVPYGSIRTVYTQQQATRRMGAQASADRMMRQVEKDMKDIRKQTKRMQAGMYDSDSSDRRKSKKKNKRKY